MGTKEIIRIIDTAPSIYSKRSTRQITTQGLLGMFNSESPEGRMGGQALTRRKGIGPSGVLMLPASTQAVSTKLSGRCLIVGRGSEGNNGRIQSADKMNEWTAAHLHILKQARPLSNARLHTCVHRDIKAAYFSNLARLAAWGFSSITCGATILAMLSTTSLRPRT